MAIKYQRETDFYKLLNSIRAIHEEDWIESFLPPDIFEHLEEEAGDIWYWEEDGELQGYIIEFIENHYFLNVNPSNIDLVHDMLDQVESAQNEFKKIMCLANNTKLCEMLKAHEYQRENRYGWFRRHNLKSLPDPILPDGYNIRTVMPDDFPELAICVRNTFGHGDWFTDDVLKWTCCHEYYYPDLDFVVTNPGNKIVSFCTFRMDPITKITQLEPMGTIPEYRGMGLGKAILQHGINTALEKEPSMIYIYGAADSPAANRLYEVTGFNDKIAFEIWGLHPSLEKVQTQ